MSIEFHCGSCNSLLRTSDDAVGKGARCPHCGNIEIVPETGLPEIQEPPGKFELGPADERFSAPREVQRPSTKYGQPHEVGSAYAAPQSMGHVAPRSAVSYEIAKTKVMIPAIILIILNLVGLMLSSLVGIAGIADVADNGAKAEDIIAFVIVGGGILLQMFSVVGCIMMLRMTHHTLSVIAMVTTMLVGLTCCFIPTGFGIWALVVLLDPDVKRFFR